MNLVRTITSMCFILPVTSTPGFTINLSAITYEDLIGMAALEIGFPNGETGSDQFGCTCVAMVHFTGEMALSHDGGRRYGVMTTNFLTL